MSVDQARQPKGKVTAKAASGVLVKANLNRQALYVFNPSTKEVWIALGETAAKEEGIWLKKESSLPYPITGYTGAVSCITSAEEGTVTFVEV